MRSKGSSELDSIISGFESRVDTIHHPGAIRLLWDVVSDLKSSDIYMHYAFHKLFECIAHTSHRNQVALCSVGLVRPLFDSLCDSRGNDTVTVELRHAIQKLLKNLLEVGTSTAEARIIFQKVIKSDGTLDTDVLEIIRTGMKARWPQHFSMESQATLALSQEGLKGMPSTGFTYMVSTLGLV